MRFWAVAACSAALACTADKTVEPAPTPDAEAARDASTRDSGAVRDSGVSDRGSSDLGSADRDLDDRGFDPVDTGVPDAEAPDPPDTGPTCIPEPPREPFTHTSSAPPMLLSETGLYADISAKAVAPDIRAFEPQFVLWSDGAEKHRWFYLPDCSKIDTHNMDHWSLPVGARAWKEFRSQGKRIETRLITRFGEGESDYWFATYAWNEDESEATYVRFGTQNARSTTHDIPAESLCISCHGRSPERFLGFSAVQLDHGNAGWSLSELQLDGRLTEPPLTPFVLPGSSTVAAGLGYLHANCSNCHNETPSAVRFIRPMSLRLLYGDTSLETTGVYQTAVGVPVEKFVRLGVTHRILPGEPGASAVAWRTSTRGIDQMPPIGTERVDPTGIDTIHAMIRDLAP